MHATRPTVRAFVRADCQPGAEQSKEEHLKTLAELRDCGRLAEVEVVPWGRNFRPGGPLSGTDYQETVTQFLDEAESWAAETGRDFESIFRRETVRSEMGGEEYEVVTLPVLCVVEVIDGTVQGVYPHDRRGAVVSVREYLAEMAPDSITVGESASTVG